MVTPAADSLKLWSVIQLLPALISLTGNTVNHFSSSHLRVEEMDSHDMTQMSNYTTLLCYIPSTREFRNFHLEESKVFALGINKVT